MNYADLNHTTGTAETQLYSNAEMFRSLANTTTEYMEVKQSDKVGECKEEVPADSVAVGQPFKGCFFFILLFSQHLEEEKEAAYASVQKSRPEQQQIYTNVPSAPQHRGEPYSLVQRV